MAPLASPGDIFGPRSVYKATAKNRAPPTAFTNKIPYLTLSANIAPEHRAIIGLALMAAGTNKTAPLDTWKSYIASYSAIMTPHITHKYSRDSYQSLQLGEADVNRIVNGFAAFQEVLEGTEEPTTQAQNVAFCNSIALPGLPHPDPILPWHESYSEHNSKVITCHYSIVLFLAGKRIQGTDHGSITRARPEALKGKAHLEGTIGFLDGGLRLSNESHILLNSAWSESSSLRAIVFTEYAKYSDMDTDFNQDLIYTTMHLLRYSGMQHAKITYNFINTYPWIVEIPSLKGPLATYMDSVRAASQFNPLIQPYIKLIYQDKSEIFPRNELEPLVACAIHVAKETDANIHDFYVSSDYASIVEVFQLELTKRLKGTTSEKKTTDPLAEDPPADAGGQADGGEPTGASGEPAMDISS